ncbi:replication-relaxation family protein [Lentibacillus cibarius]|uniref:Replication-relaxation n=1 Tax=Lentibacillus cibarius TaxID=2583219 RepID=A0A5S3QJ02_9BACI|nr:replication-relaxation family protein [Lentibacillus cibarius]TMN21835.1 hypothetical protein FFL34_06700 [Lentibacillus cibarius]
MERITTLKGTGRSRLEVKESEIQYLAYLEKHRVLTLQQLHTVATELFGVILDSYSFKNRMRKFEQFKLIRSKQYADGFNGERFKYVSIGIRAVDLLIENKLLDADFNQQNIYKYIRKENLLHYLVTQQAIINILLANQRESYMYNQDIFSFSNSDYPYHDLIRKKSMVFGRNSGAQHAAISSFKNGTSQKSKSNYRTYTIIKPDWVIKLDLEEDDLPSIINIEADMGTEPLATLEEKFWKYCILAKNRSHERHLLLFVFPDKSFSNRSSFVLQKKRVKNFLNILNLQTNKKIMEEAKISVATVPLSGSAERSLLFFHGNEVKG